MRNREDFEALLGLGYSVKEALSMLPEDGKKEEAPAPQPEEKPEPKQELKPEQKQEPKQEEAVPDFVSSMNASLTNIMNALNTLTKAVQAGNRTTMGSDEDPYQKKADDFLKTILEGRTN